MKINVAVCAITKRKVSGLPTAAQGEMLFGGFLTPRGVLQFDAPCDKIWTILGDRDIRVTLLVTVFDSINRIT